MKVSAVKGVWLSGRDLPSGGKLCPSAKAFPGGMMTLKATAILIALLALAFLPLGAEAGWATLNSAEYGFSLDYPDDWDTQINDGALLAIAKIENDLPLVIAVAAEPILEGDENGLFAPDLEKTMEEVEAEILALGLGEAVVIERGESELNGFPAYVLDLKLVLVDILEMRMYNIVVDQGENSVYLSFSAECGAYEDNLEIFDRVKNSFRLHCIEDEVPADPDQPEKAY